MKSGRRIFPLFDTEALVYIVFLLFFFFFSVLEAIRLRAAI